MTRQLTKREKAMIVVLALMLVFLVYNQLVLKPTTAEMSTIEKNMMDTESSMLVETVKNTRLVYMKNQLAALGKTPNTTITTMPIYDNSQNVIVELAGILTAATDYQLSFPQTKEEGNLVRRTININFTCTGYEKAGLIMKQLASSRYRCRIIDFSIVAKADKTASTTIVQAADITKNPLQVSLIVIFYELKVK
jgi:hypothetical protein